MTARKLHIDRLHLRRAPGIADGFRLEELSSGVNVVFGPNGSGKTTTSSAIEALLWRGRPEHRELAVSGRFQLGGSEWLLDVDGARAPSVRCDGEHASPPDLARKDLNHRYRLHLHELLRADANGADFAAAILRESAGGHDLDGAAESLGMNGSMPRRSREADALEVAEKKYQAALGAEEALSREAASLHELQQQRQAAREAGAQVALLKAAIAHAQAVREEELARAAAEQFDPRIGRLAGDELKALRELDDRAAGAERVRRDAIRRRDAAASEAARLLPAGAPDDALLPVLHHALTALTDAKQRADAAEDTTAGAMRRCADVESQVGAEAADRLDGIDLEGVGDLAGFARDAGELVAAQFAARQQLELLQAPPARTTADSCVRGMQELQAWLAVPERDATMQEPLRRYAIIGGVLALVAGLAGVLGGELAFAVFIAGSAVLLFLTLRSRPVTDPRAGFRERYERLGLPKPDRWDRGPVGELLEEIQRRWKEAVEATIHEERRRAIEQELATLERTAANIEKRRLELVLRFGVPSSSSPTQLAWLGQRIADWQRARSEVVAARDVALGLRAREAAVRTELVARLRSVGADAGTVAELAGAVQALERRVSGFRAAETECRLADGELRTAEESLSRSIADRESLLARVGITEAEIDLLREWIEQRDAFRAALERLASARRHVARCRSDHEANGGEPDMLAEPEAVLQARHDEASARSDELDSIASGVGELEFRIRQAKEGDSVAAALEDVDRCRDALAEARAADAERAVAQALLAHLQGATRDQQRPPVFREAQRLFAVITHGRYTLDLDDGDPVHFRARDNEQGVVLELHELSSGTRVQLLLAVRLAFVESQEREHGGACLPLLLDETLGTSDDARAQAIMEAVIEIARGGRQVFYFTAQRDEVEKWLGVLAAHGESARLVDLVEARRLERTTVVLHAPRAVPRRPLPQPEGCTHVEYGMRLGVPSIARDAASMSGVHLWHLVDELPLLHHLLCHGIESWGQLEAMMETGGRDLLVDFPEAYARIRAAAAALQAAQGCARIGHGRRVDALAIEESGAVSPNFMDRVLALVDASEGDAARVLEGIDRIPRFHASKRDLLREYFLAHGYLSTSSPLSPGEIHARTLGAVAHELQAGRLTFARLDTLVAAVLPPPVSAEGELPVAHPGLAAATVQIQDDAISLN